MNNYNIDEILSTIINKFYTEYSEIINKELIISKYEERTYEKIKEKEVYDLLAEICINISSIDPIYSKFGGNILINYLHKNTFNNFVDKVEYLYDYYDDKFLNFVRKNKEELNSIIDYDKDYNYDYFGFKTLEKSYLLKKNNLIVERPLDLFLRCAITVQMNNMKNIKKTYDYMTNGYYIHATPTLFNSGMKKMQLSSCFLLGVNDDLNDINKSFLSCTKISKWSGGLGLHLSGIRAKNSVIKGTHGISNGLVPLIKIYNDLARWIDQGGKRQGSICIYLEPHHPDVIDFLELRKNYGSDNERARDIFLALWVSDLFMEYVKENKKWYLFSPEECPDLNNVYGDEYKKLYNEYVEKNMYRKSINARNLWNAILEAQVETGMPYISFKDTVNKNSNQKNIGIIRSSNLCNEIVQYSDNDEYGVCNLASIGLKKFVKPYNNNKKFIIYTKEDCIYCDYAKTYMKKNNIEFTEIKNNVKFLKDFFKSEYIKFPQIFDEEEILIGGWKELFNYIKSSFDFEKLFEVSYQVTKNLNNIIDISYYPVIETKKSNFKHRPIGIGIQGLADTLSLLKIPFDTEESLKINSKIMETIYLATITASNDIAKKRYYNMLLLDIGNNIIPEYYDKNFLPENELYHKLKPTKYEFENKIGHYSTFKDSPFSKGIFQFDFYDNINLNYPNEWNELKEKVIKYGTRNSLLTALMPTAATSQILSNNECFEHFTNNIYTRKTQAGDFLLVNKYLIKELKLLNLWDKKIKDIIIANEGSIQNINIIPSVIKKLYKTIWEISQVNVLKNARARAPFVDQSQSMNIFFGNTDFNKLSLSHFWAWENKLKTGMYYLRSKPATNPIQFTIDPTIIKDCINCSS